LPTVAELAQQELSRRYSLQGRTQVAPRVQTMQNARPTVRSALSNLMRDAVDATGLEGGYRQGLLNAAGGVEAAVDFLPVVGDVLGLEDASRAYGQGDMVGAGINMMGVVPIIGDAGVKLSKGARSALRDQGFTEGFFHASKQDIQDGFKAGYSDGMVFVTPEREFANNWVGKGKYQQRLGEDNIDDMRRADRQKLWDEYESQYGSYENWPSEIEDEYHKRSVNLAQQYQASGGAIYPVAVKANKQFDPEENPEVIAEFLKSQGRDPNATTIVSGKTDLEAYQEGNYLFYENKEMADFLKDKGYDSVWLREDTTKSGLSKPFSTLAVLDETGVKPVYDFAREADTAAKGARSALRVRPPSDNITNVRNANFQYPKTIGDETVNINSITGNLRVDQQEQNRINRLADQISSPEGYISRIIVDQNNNVIEGQHRLEALRQLGAKEVPVYKIEELADTMPVRKMEEAINTVGNIHSDHVNQIMQYALDNIAEEGVQGARNFDFGNFQKYYDAALNAVEDGESAFVGDVAAKGVKGASSALRNIYHGTSSDAARAIDQFGFDLGKTADGSAWFTTNPDIGEVAAAGKGGVIQRQLDESNLKLASYDETDKYLKDQLIDMGYDGAYYPDQLNGSTHYEIWNQDKLNQMSPLRGLEMNTERSVTISSSLSHNSSMIGPSPALSASISCPITSNSMSCICSGSSVSNTSYKSLIHPPWRISPLVSLIYL
jgi:hypothetical protein